MPLPIRSITQDVLKPNLCLSPRIAKHKAGVPFLDRRDHRFDHLRAKVPRPRKTVHALRQDRVDYDLLLHVPLDQDARFRLRSQERLHRAVQVPQRRRDPPRPNPGTNRPQSRQTKLRLNTTLGGNQLMPFVYDHTLQVRKRLAVVGMREHQTQAFRCSDQRLWSLRLLLRPFAAGGIPRPNLHPPFQS